MSNAKEPSKAQPTVASTEKKLERGDKELTPKEHQIAAASPKLAARIIKALRRRRS
jgi:hypothetical protein